MSAPRPAPPDGGIVFENVSKFYGEVLGVNRVSMTVTPGITSLVGPNGSGKTTLMNLMSGLLRPTRGTIRVLGIAPDDPDRLFRVLGYCTQHDAFPRGITGFEFLRQTLRLHGFSDDEARRGALRAIERVGLIEAKDRRVAGYSKGMRQRIKLAQAIAHEPRVLVLDEPLNGLDPMARAEVIALFRALAADGVYVLISSHILHEVDLLSDRVVMLHRGHLAAEGAITDVREEMTDKPLQFRIRCPLPHRVAARVFAADAALAVQIAEDNRALVVDARDGDRFAALFGTLVAEEGLEIDGLAPADEDVSSVYRYLIGEGESA